MKVFLPRWFLLSSVLLTPYWKVSSCLCRCQNVHFQRLYASLFCAVLLYKGNRPVLCTITLIALSYCLVCSTAKNKYTSFLSLFSLLALPYLSLFLLCCISQVSERHLCALNVEWRWCLVVLKQACLSAVWIQTETYWFLLYEAHLYATYIQRKAHTHLLADAHSLFQNYSSAYMDKDMRYIIM